MKLHLLQPASELEEALLADLQLPQHRRVPEEVEASLNQFVGPLMAAARAKPIVYTAYDGDHFFLAPRMRALALSEGFAPANPESILGYRETVLANQTKDGVLRDDLAILRGCDLLWVFTDVAPTPEGLPTLAEGVVVELLFFLKRRPDAEVWFCPIRSLVRGTFGGANRYTANYEESLAGLHEMQRGGVLSLANSGDRTDRELKEVVYYIIDVLDAKYVHWLRPWAYQEGRVPLVPQLAIESQDVVGGPTPMSDLLLHWLALIRLGSRAIVMPKFGNPRSASLLPRLLETAWVRYHSQQSLRLRDWRELQIPKARQGRRWPLTALEGGV